MFFLLIYSSRRCFSSPILEDGFATVTECGRLTNSIGFSPFGMATFMGGEKLKKSLWSIGGNGARNFFYWLKKRLTKLFARLIMDRRRRMLAAFAFFANVGVLNRNSGNTCAQVFRRISMKMWVSKKEFVPNWMVRHPYKASIVRGEEYERNSYVIICPKCGLRFRYTYPLNGGSIDFLRKHRNTCAQVFRGNQWLD